VIAKVCDQPQFVAKMYEAQGNWSEAALNYFIAMQGADDSEATDIQRSWQRCTAMSNQLGWGELNGHLDDVNIQEICLSYDSKRCASF